MIKIQFNIKYSTQPGELILMSGNIPELGDGETSKAVTMQYLSPEYWTLILDIKTPLIQLPETIQYTYYFKSAAGLQQEAPDGKTIEIKKITTSEIQVFDTWNFEGSPQNVFFTAPFKHVLLPAVKTSIKNKSYRGNTHVFKVKAPLLKEHETLALLGSSGKLSNWNVQEPVWLSKQDDWWTTKLNLQDSDFPIAYKYAIYDSRTKLFKQFEEGNNRLLHEGSLRKKTTLLHDGFVHMPANIWKGAGVAIPVFSIRTEKGLGTGEFSDIKILADWASKTGIQLIQLLPVNDTSATLHWTDSYPYHAISTFALHPLYLNVEAADHSSVLDKKTLLENKIRLNNLKDVDYEQVIQLKWVYIRQLYAAQKESLLQDENFTAFFEDNSKWLVPYAAFCYLRNKYKTSDFTHWGRYAVFNYSNIQKLTDKAQRHFDEIAIHYFVQYQLHSQLKAATDYARSVGVVMKGDIAIGVNRTGCDVWMESQYFNTNMQAGAPPDAFAVKGQNWGFPTYNWHAMQQDDYAWWKRRFAHMSRYFDAFRIDHILGFFRIWSIPLHAVEGIMGYFVPANPLHINAFAQKAISFDHHRFCEPYITDTVLDKLCASDLEKKQSLLNFLQGPDNDHAYQLQPAFRTQRDIVAYFNLQPTDDGWVKNSLLSLVSNILLIEPEDSDGQHFHFRFNMFETLSFQLLPDHLKHPLYTLYDQYFYHMQEALWQQQAMATLPALKRSTNMLVCGEDLGMVPRSVPYVMHQLGILSLEIQRMPKHPGQLFFHPSQAPYLSVVAPSTHDMSTIRGWWEENRETTQLFFQNELQHPGLAPYFCEPWINLAIVIQHLYSPAMWSIFLLQDLMGINGTLRREKPQEERINQPDIARFYWKYRMHITVEELLKNDDFNNEVEQYILLSGRGKY